MNVLKIVMTRFMSHDKTELELPKKGIVLVTGPNGAGKSSLIESVSMALWGKTLRGTPPWRDDGQAAIVGVGTDIANVQRVRAANGKVRLGWAKPDDETADEAPHEYESTAKAQGALEAVIGQHDIWRRCSVFSSSDAMHFTMSTDGERKRLLEAVLGLERFDNALETCRLDLKAAVQRRTLAEQRLSVMRVELEGHLQRHNETRDHLNTLPPASDLSKYEEELGKLDGLIKKYDADVRGCRASMDQARRSSAVAQNERSRAQGTIDEFKGGKCPSCKQDIPKEQWAKLQANVQAAEEQARFAIEGADKIVKDQEAALEEVEEEREVLVGQRGALAEKVAVARSQAATRARLEKTLADADRLTKTAAHEVQTLEHSHRALAGIVRELEATEVVLGLKGVRAHILGRALTGLEQVANVWLSRIASSELRVQLKPYSEKKTGGVSDAISFEVAGAGGGHGYKAASGGERRRIDIACLLALAEVAQQAHGRPPGTLFFDEVFDALDADGVDAVGDALRLLANDRAVVIITHSDLLDKKLDWFVRLRIACGKADVVRS